MSTTNLRQALILALSSAATVTVCMALTLGSGRSAQARQAGHAMQSPTHAAHPVNDDLGFTPRFLTGDTGAPTCIGDVNGSGAVDTVDLLALLAAWGPCVGCKADFDGNNAVDTVDLLALLAGWGPCP